MKIVILGAAGGIGQGLALLLKSQLPAGSELALYDVNSITPGVAVDLSHIPTDVTVNGFSGKDPTLALLGADIVLIAAGIARKPGMARSDLFDVNAGIVQQLTEDIAHTCPKALVGIITNPVNSTVVISAETFKKAGVYNKNKLFGITTLDIIRARSFVAKLKNKVSENIKVPVIGGHSGVTILPLLSQIPDISLTESEIKTLTQSIQNAGTEVVKAKEGGGSATLSMAYAAALFCFSLVRALNGEKGIVEYAYVESDCKQYPRFFAQPVLLNENGIAEYKEIGALSAFEQEHLEKMLYELNKDIELAEQFNQ
ncbi:malate dehydrogenase [Candidatus Williamhamiltonella defendens]|uniref:Malate dehydrogenase n=1 Tax=Candidatus Hamiltonella defensa (Bemisia tabaci) TaxID=672795 RepID=A0A249DZA7_9ENTR|nr:malate dehydrogenase [Candidatus Hamiltonella defensa]ASX26430.1 malate dehydrogenase [Candidatus Hamiltonella defensa (Bemisia tabaci)]CED78982.1 Malate dehydrogenase [Candidatus Hamiltonella defensa (Bemisia tabaci)]